MAGDEFSGISSLQIFVFDFNVHDFWSVDFLKFENLFSKACVFVFELSELLLITISQSFVVIELVLELIMFIIIRNFKFIDLVFKENDLWSVVLFKGLDFYKLLVWLFLFGVLQLSLHIMVGSRHQIFEFIDLFFELDLTHFLFVDNIVAANGHEIELFDLVL